MNILGFAINYSDEEACRKKIKQQSVQMGATCRYCNCKEHYWLENPKAGKKSKKVRCLKMKVIEYGIRHF